MFSVTTAIVQAIRCVLFRIFILTILFLCEKIRIHCTGRLQYSTLGIHAMKSCAEYISRQDMLVCDHGILSGPV